MYRPIMIYDIPHGNIATRFTCRCDGTYDY